MMFKEGDRVTVIGIDNFRFALPTMFKSQNFSKMVEEHLKAKGYKYELYGKDVLITEVMINPQKKPNFRDHHEYACESICITDESYIARECKDLLQQLGVRVFMNTEPKVFKTMYILYDEKENKMYAKENLVPGYKYLDQCEGYFTNDGLFSCELGECIYELK